MYCALQEFENFWIKWNFLFPNLLGFEKFVALKVALKLPWKVYNFKSILKV